MDERALLPWLVPLLIALGVVFVVALLVAIFAALRTKRRQTQEEASAAPQRGVSLGTYAPRGWTQSFKAHETATMELKLTVVCTTWGS
jgi:hypothetical protein